MFGDKPSGEVVDTWGARRICEMRAANHTVAAIARHFSTSVSTVKSILDEHHTRGTHFKLELVSIFM